MDAFMQEMRLRYQHPYDTLLLEYKEKVYEITQDKQFFAVCPRRKMTKYKKGKRE
jgi:hypothetical protein